MKKKCILIIICITAILISSCKQTPDAPTVQIKSDLQNATKNVETGSEKNYIITPKTWTVTDDIGKKLSVDIQAEIDIPELTNIKTYNVTPKKITQDMATKYIDVLFNGAQAYEQRPANIITQEDIIKDVNRIREFLVEMKEQDSNRYNEESEYWNNLIKEQLNRLGQFPEKYEDIAFDGMFKNEKKFLETRGEINPDVSKIAIWADIGNENPATITIQQSDNFKDGNFVFNNGKHDSITEVRLKPNEVDQPRGLNISMEEAISDAKKMLEELGFEGYFFQTANLGVLGSKPYVVTTQLAKDINPYFFDLLFTQKKDNIQLSYANPYSIISVENMYSEYWGNEVIQVFVDDSGVFVINWLFPTQIEKTLEENVSLLKFSDIQDIITNNLSYTYMPSEYEQEVENRKLYVDKIEFAYRKKLVLNSNFEYCIVPCWNVYGKIQNFYSDDIQDPNFDEDNSYTDSYQSGTLLCINAIDGTLI